MKRIWKKALCVGMTAVMTAGTLSGCGKQEKELTTIRLNEVAHSIFYAPQPQSANRKVPFAPFSQFGTSRIKKPDTSSVPGVVLRICSDGRSTSAVA